MHAYVCTCLHMTHACVKKTHSLIRTYTYTHTHTHLPRLVALLLRTTYTKTHKQTHTTRPQRLAVQALRTSKLLPPGRTPRSCATRKSSVSSGWCRPIAQPQSRHLFRAVPLYDDRLWVTWEPESWRCIVCGFVIHLR
jgi:hypothetical protein